MANQCVEIIVPLLTGKGIGMKHRLIENQLERRNNARIAMTGVSNKNCAGEIDPTITPGIVNLESLCTIPDHGQLTMHRARLDGIQFFQKRNAFGNRNRSLDPTKL